MLNPYLIFPMAKIFLNPDLFVLKPISLKYKYEIQAFLCFLSLNPLQVTVFTIIVQAVTFIFNSRWHLSLLALSLAPVLSVRNGTYFLSAIHKYVCIGNTTDITF